MKEPIIHIGYFKTGTTWFQQVFFPNAKDVLFSNKANASLDDNLVLARPYGFSGDKVKNCLNDIFDNDSSKQMVLSRERLSGHPFSGGYDARVIADRLKETFPNASIVIFLREQNRAIESTFKEYVKRGGTAPFKKWILTKERTIPSFELDYFNYFKQVWYYSKLFGKESVKVYLYEDFRKDPLEFLKKLCTELEIEVDLTQFDFNKKVNKGFSTLSIRLLRWSNKFSTSKNLNPYPGLKIPFLRFLVLKICNVLDAVFYDKINPHFITPEINEKIKHTFGESNRSLSEFLGVDLKSKGYYC